MANNVPSSQHYEQLRKHLEAQSFKCQCYETLQESDEDGNPFIRFHCRLPSSADGSLYFDCRAPSCGALELTKNAEDDNDNDVEESHVVKEWNELEEGWVDPHIFDSGYTLAGRTGFQVWAGARLLLEYIIQNESFSGQSASKVIELGAGVGLVGSAFAVTHQGSEVLLTDLPTLVDHSIEPNLKVNGTIVAGQVAPDNRNRRENGKLPEWLLQQPIKGSDANVYEFGTSYVATNALDWTRPVCEQICLPGTDVDLILASDCVWLVSMLESLLDTVSDIMGHKSKFLLSMQKREVDGTESAGMFTTVQSVLDAIEERSWKWACVAWKPVRLVDGQDSEAFAFEITR